MSEPRQNRRKGVGTGGRRSIQNAFANSELIEKTDPETLFEDLQQVGRGSFGAVFKATKIDDGETVAIKKITQTKKNTE
eukprot:Pgem_evm1s3749